MSHDDFDRSDVEHRSKLTELSNEYATVELYEVRTQNGVRLELISPKLHHRIVLDPLELESLSWQEKDIFSEFLSTPFGPEDE
jgi:hypothetical protein